MKIQYFGNQNVKLLGAYHPPRRSINDAAVLICPPIGQEYIRTHWALRLLANQLSRKGIHVLRFDYRGHGDSCGDIQDVASLDEWRDDISVAIDHLKEQSGAQTVMLTGLRVGASLASDVSADRDDVNSVVAWERIVRGSDYLRDLRSVHESMIDLWFQPIKTPSDESTEEILGWRWRRSLINELETWAPNFASLTIPQLVISLSGHDQRETTEPSFNPLEKQLDVDDDSDWTKLCKLEAAWLRPRTSQLIVKSAVDMFQRLEKRGLLERQNEPTTVGVG